MEKESGNHWHHSVFDPCVMTMYYSNWLQALPSLGPKSPLRSNGKGVTDGLCLCTQLVASSASSKAR